MHELELKLEVPPSRRDAVEKSLFADATSQVLSASYFDTADRRLASREIALRLRKEGARWVQTLKAGAGNPLRRLEHNASVDMPAEGSQPVLDLSRHVGTPAGDALQAALAGVVAPTLQRIYGTDIVRQTVICNLAEGVVEAAFDVGTISAGDRSLDVCEVEIELKDGSPAAMVGLARQWVLEHGLWLSTTAKSTRGDRLAARGDAAPAVHARPAKVQRKMAGAALLGATLDSCLAHVLANASEVGAGNAHEETVHQLRVGIRRLRTALGELGALAEGLDPTWEEALVALFRQLGQLRDHETVTHGALADLTAAGAPPIELPMPSLAPPDVAQAVRAVPVQMALLGLVGFAFELEGPRAGSAGRKSLRHVRRRLDKLHRQVVRDGARFESLPVEDQHRVRKRLKRLRYLGEFVAPLFKGRAADRYLAALRPAQDALGARNDAAVALEAYRDAAAHDPNAWFAVGWLAAQGAPSARRCRKALTRIADEPRFWDR